MLNEVGVSYYTREEFELAKRKGLPGVSEFQSYNEWLEEHNRLVDQLLKRGIRVVEIVVETREFLRWHRNNKVSGEGAVAEYTAEMLRLGKKRGKVYIP